MASIRSRLIVVAALAVASHAGAHAAPFSWKSNFTKGSSPALAALHESIHKEHASGFIPVAIADKVWTEEDFELTLQSGTLYLEPPVEGRTVGGFFEGKATVSFKPAWGAAETSLRMALGSGSLESVAIDTVYLFSLNPDSLLATADRSATPAVPSHHATYLVDKAAMRQLGLDLTEAFLNREGPARKTTYVLFPMQAIRGPRSEEARLLYSFNPLREQQVGLAVFGHEELAEQKPFKFRFYDLASYDAEEGSVGAAGVDRYQLKITLGTAAKSAVEVATLHMRASPGAGGVRFNMHIQMEVSSVTTGEGKELPFLQWETLRNDPDFDQTLLIANPPLPAGQVVVKAAGLLFEPWLGAFVLVDEDNWYPRLPTYHDAHHELELTIPKRLIGIGIGQKVSEEEAGTLRKIAYRTTQPVDQSTFYYGDYTVVEGMADKVKVQLFQDRRDPQQQRLSRFILTEVSNAIRVFNKMLVPLDIENLRVTATLPAHGRGFEGLILLGGGGTESTESGSDLFRAHEVAHQWWGNYVRVKRWPEDRWLSESFAEFSAMEYYKARFEDPKKTTTLMREAWFDPLTTGSIRLKTLTGEEEKTVGGTVFPLLAGTNNVYSKGPLVINMLRYLFRVQKKNDEAFFVMLRDFLTTWRYKAASTADFQAIAERHLGMKLDWFFHQWVEDGGLPILRWSHQVVQEEGSWVVKLEAKQEQKSYRLIVPVHIRLGGDKMAVTPWLIEGASASRSIKVPSKPEGVSLNENLEALLILRSD